MWSQCYLLNAHQLLLRFIGEHSDKRPQRLEHNPINPRKVEFIFILLAKQSALKLELTFQRLSDRLFSSAREDWKALRLFGTGPDGLF